MYSYIAVNFHSKLDYIDSALVVTVADHKHQLANSIVVAMSGE